MRLLLLPLLCLPALSAAATDVIVADFEGEDFGSWKVTGSAFGKGPVAGSLPGQMQVSGFIGQRLVNGYHGGDDALGTLESPEFKVERKFLNFLIGGGRFPGETCMDLLLDGKVVRTATGRYTQPGGSERLDWQTWDVADLAGKSVSLRITDKRTGTWGHINVDNIVQSDAPKTLELKKEFAITDRYLIWPVSRDPSQRQRFWFTLDGEEKPLLYADICLSNNPDFWVFTDLADHQGRKVTVTGTIPGVLGDAWEKVKISDTYPGEEVIYQEELRPQYHFSSRRGWLNDPNGMVWHDGQWHLFYQHNPYNHGWHNMTWGHAVSSDLFHWKEKPPGLQPDQEGYMYSGSGIFAPKGSTALPVKGDSLVLAYTANGNHGYEPGHKVVQSLAFSEDGGKTFTKFKGNPVLPHVVAENRDPKIFWHEPSKHWVMPLYYDGEDYGIYTSPDMVKWEKTSDYKIPTDGECPDLFELPVDGDAKNTRWIAWGAQGKYMLGSFDGKTFKPESGPHQHYFGAAYAGQSYDNAPDKRRVHIGWMRDTGAGFQGMPFNLQMTLPMDFTLRKQGDGIRLWSEPSKEVEGIRSATKDLNGLAFSSGQVDPLAEFKGGQYEIEAVIDVAATTASEVGFRIFDDHAAIWKPGDEQFTGARGKQAPVDGKLNVRIFVDTVSMEVFVNGTYVSKFIRQLPGTKPIRIVANGGEVKFDTLKVHTLKSVWK
ncbi:glycoside hydrolase family 32 protein [Luteolibacter flavescens]|uniref:Glycoside hydrolase family 32 protein n=1 Tax=Luteolibacter flavescens TaxID=1859460 RepID=A0ABT3FS52_9BACT|nr:glycoside hydrolase family 32 protein [Luteolibacter flavescens]MCW1886398.1 glycoside hydrolase family 32 protein [Luteolibacter flavescens]